MSKKFSDILSTVLGVTFIVGLLSAAIFAIFDAGIDYRSDLARTVYIVTIGGSLGSLILGGLIFGDALD